jgi:HK97 family phage prohead protease
MAMETVHKAGRQSEDNPYEFILSDESVDRMGDVIRVKGWELDSFKNNPIALFGHDHTLPIGVWTDVKVVGKQLRGTLKMAKQGTSEFIDGVRSLIEQKILRAVSVGFQPIAAKPREDGGYDYTRSSLHEVSVVSVPANQNALAIAKALSPQIAEICFAEPGSCAADGTGRLAFNSETPNLDAVRERLKSLGNNR